MDTVLMIAFAIMLIFVTVVDMKKRVIPNGFIMIIGIIAVMAMVFQENLTFFNRLMGFLCVSLILLVMTLLVPNAFGGGDIKLMAVCGFYLGVHLTLLSFVFAVFGGGLYGIWLLVVKNKGRKEHFAFGPFLCGGMMIAMLFGLANGLWI